jgi:hypothetical protein
VLCQLLVTCSVLIIIMHHLLSVQPDGQLLPAKADEKSGFFYKLRVFVPGRLSQADERRLIANGAELVSARKATIVFTESTEPKTDSRSVHVRLKPVASMRSF